MIGSADHPMLSFGMPPDVVAWGALGIALLLLVVRIPRLAPRTQLLALCLGAFGLSWGYFFFYLGGAPRIIDATTYFLQARSIAEGSFSFEVPSPSASFRGRFLIHTANDAHRLAGIFPPGYPTVLALGVKVGAPLLVGPLLAAGLVAATYSLGRAVTGRHRDALIAAAFSTICACLRYHTAETMSHGLSALLVTLALWITVRLIRGETRVKLPIALGLVLGLLVATRQLTGALVAAGCTTSLLWLHPKECPRLFARMALGLIPGCALLLWHQHSITGDIFTSAQVRYYDLADGPPGCFGLGLGKGCAYEHADVVAQQGGHGLTAGWTVRNTLHRLHFHLLDIANFEPLVLVALPLLWNFRARKSLRPLLLVLALIPLGYSLFYFAGSYPGAGARLFSELLPIWHVLIGWALCRLRVAKVGLALALLGFAVHASFGHGMLKQQSFGPNGKPLEQITSLLGKREATATDQTKPIVFFSTAHEFNLAALSDRTFIAARTTHDAREQLLARGATSAFHYRRDDGTPTLVPLEQTPPPTAAPITFEAEFDYPPLGKRNLWVHPEHVPAACASRGRALALHPTTGDPHLTVEIPSPVSGAYEVTVIGLKTGTSCVSLPLKDRAILGTIDLGPEVLSNLSHIDRILLTHTHL